MKRYIISEKGQQLATVALLLPVLVALMGLVVDVGNAYAHKLMAQNAADAAASAAGMVLYQQGASVAETTARYYAGLHGYNDDRVHNWLRFSWPSQCIRVQISEAVTPVFASIVWSGTFRVNATASACYKTTGVSSNVIVLNRHDCSALKISGGAQVRVAQGNLHVNSDCADKAIDMSGSAALITQTPTTYVGGIKTSGSAHITPLPVRSSYLPDPLATLPAPASCSACPSAKKMSIGSDTRVTLSPGCFEGGISISGAAEVTFNPGVYCIGGDGLKISGSADVSGSRVTFYFMEDSFDLSGGASFGATPPTSGAYAGILIFQARNNPSRSDISGGTLADSQGIIYLPAGELSVSGGSALRTNFVVDQLTVTGGARIDVQGYTGPGWSAITDVLTE